MAKDTFLSSKQSLHCHVPSPGIQKKYISQTSESIGQLANLNYSTKQIRQRAKSHHGAQSLTPAQTNEPLRAGA